MRTLACLLLFVCFVPGIFAQQQRITVYFETGQYLLPETERSKLIFSDTIIVTGISVKGYCDDRGTEAGNYLLSQRRVLEVQRLLVEQGIPERLVRPAEAMGELQLSGRGTADEERRLNRRADLVITNTHPPKNEPVPEVKENTPVAPPVEIFSDTIKEGDVIVLESILFEGGRTIFLDESYPTLKALARVMLEKPGIHILILGHICCRPPGEEGMDFGTGKNNLSQARAKAVYDYLVANGVDASRLKSKGRGSDFPTGKGDKADRRVEIVITKTGR